MPHLRRKPEQPEAREQPETQIKRTGLTLRAWLPDFGKLSRAVRRFRRGFHAPDQKSGANFD